MPLPRLRAGVRPDAVKFEFVRDAGTLACEGRVGGGSGSGSYTFRPDPAYPAALQRLGYEAPKQDDLMQMALADVSLAFAQEVHEAGLRATTGDLMQLRVHGIGTDYIRDARTAGYAFEAPDFIQLKIHGVHTAYLRDLKSAGFDWPARDIVQLPV